MLLSAEILEILAVGKVVKGLESTAQKWAEELTKDTIESAFKARKYYHDDNVQFSVIVSIGTPDEES